MRLNRGTLILILGSVVVIAVLFVLSGQQASAPSANGTPTVTAVSLPVFPDLADASKIVRFEITNTADSSKVAMTKDAGGVWTVADATFAQSLATDQTKASSTVNNLVTIVAVDKFETTSPADFGLDKPAYTMVLTDSDGKTYTIKVGKAAVANPRYYAFVNDDTTNVYVLAKDVVDGLIGQIAQPAYVASPTPTATSTATPNPYSEVEQTATQNAVQQQVYATMTATALGTYSPTIVPTPEVTSEATTEATAEMTAEATVEATTEATVEMTPEATTAPAAEATTEATAEATASS